jgi:murein DD-endopeptidase MepM/ murein hydrolase activator NlpD
MGGKTTEKTLKNPFFTVTLLLIFTMLLTNYSYSDYQDGANYERVEQLQEEIKKKNQEIEEIKKEIENYRKELVRVSEKRRNLDNDLRRLELTSKKLDAEISLTKKKISAEAAILERIGLEIEEKNNQISDKKNYLGETIRELNEKESKTPLEILLAYDRLSEFFGDIQRIEYLQKEINFSLSNLRELKKNLEKSKAAEKKIKEELEIFHEQLKDRQHIAELNKKEKSTLLQETKSQERRYQQLLKERLVRQKELAEEIAAIEEQIRIEIDPTSLPKSGSGVLLWPLDEVHITQYFGETPFATKNPQVYNGKGHNGIDLRADIGTPVKAAASGVVTAIGDTDKQCRGVSYGKWILIEHNNNLSTLYAHLSLIKVKNKQKIAAGEIIGYSGNSGYVTGPHLHFGVFATKAIDRFEYKSKICGTIMNLPIVSSNGYLNPLSYL